MQMKKRWCPKLITAALALAVAACSAPSERPVRVVPVPEPTPLTITWAPCEATEVGAECARATMPMREDGSDATIDVQLRRILARDPANRGKTQLWYLAGGPGGSGTALLDLLYDRYGDGLPDVDWYTLDHRGTGGSGRLSCPEQERPETEDGIGISPAEGPACVEHLRATRDDLDAVGTTPSARDLGRIIHETREGAKVIVWGNSYGTYWANRYLQLFPDQPDGVFVEALVPATASYRSFDFYMNETGMRLMAMCADDERCARHFDGDPVGVAKALPGRLAAGHCADLGTATPISWMLGSLLYDRDLREAIPALVFRLSRCNEEDKAAVRHLHDLLFKAGMLFAGDFSTPLYAHVVLSEIWDDRPLPGPPLERVAAECLFCPADRHEMDAAQSAWPTYDPAPFDDGFADYNGPLLMLQGELDPAVDPRAVAQMKVVFTRPHQTFVSIPSGGHTIVGKTPPAEGKGDCASKMLARFIDNPRASPDTSCIAELRQPLLDGSGPLVEPLLGQSAWGE